MRVTMIGGLAWIGCVACTEPTAARSSAGEAAHNEAAHNEAARTEAAHTEEGATGREGAGAPDLEPARDRRSWGSTEATERLEREGLECVEGQGCTRRLPDGTVVVIDF